MSNRPPNKRPNSPPHLDFAACLRTSPVILRRLHISLYVGQSHALPRQARGLLSALLPEVRIVQAHGRLLAHLVHRLPRQLRPHFFLKIRTDFLEGLGVTVFHLNDVVTERSLRRLAELTHGEAEHPLIELRHHLTARKRRAQRSAISGGS